MTLSPRSPLLRLGLLGTSLAACGGDTSKSASPANEVVPDTAAAVSATPETVAWTVAELDQLK